MMSLMTSGGVESFLYIGTACWYREVPIVSIPPTQQTLTAVRTTQRTTQSLLVLGAPFLERKNLDDLGTWSIGMG